jgi:hypothetical protein
MYGTTMDGFLKLLRRRLWSLQRIITFGASTLLNIVEI